MLRLTCQSCGVIDSPNVSIQVFKDGTEHVRADCASCGAYIKYLPKANRSLVAYREPKINLFDLLGGGNNITPKAIAPPPIRKSPPKVETFWDDCLPENPLAKALVKEHGLFIRKDDEKQRYLIEFKTEKLMQIALRHISDIENALNRKYQAYYRAVFFSLEPLVALAELGVNDD